MTDLLTWFREALSSEEAHAQKDLWALDRASAGGEWEASYGFNLPYSLIMAGRAEIGRLTASAGPLPDGAEDLHAADAFLVARMVRKARARAERTLRTVAAHREILDRHSPREVMNNDGVRVIGVECAWCVTPDDGHLTTMREDWPCPDVRSLAAIYRDRPGFDPSWIPEDPR